MEAGYEANGYDECVPYAGKIYAQIMQEYEEQKEFDAWMKEESRMTEAKYRMECIEAATIE